MQGNERVRFFAVQTVFEGYHFNTRDKLRQNQLKYHLRIPMAHAAGNPDTGVSPEIMRNYRSGGTPWTVIINSEGRIVYNGFHIDADQAVKMIREMTARQK